jgi:hypothetical protein
MVDLAGVIHEWCKAQAAYDSENYPGGFPRYATARRLYLAGRALYSAAHTTPAEGRYAANRWFDRPTPAQLALLDRAGMK